MVSEEATCGKAFIHAGSTRLLWIAPFVVLLAAGCGRRAAHAAHPRAASPRATASAKNRQQESSQNIFSETGIASWYGDPYDGRRSASGEIFDKQKLTAAHRTLPFETWVCVVNLENGKSVEVRINDRGPFVDGRIIDLSQGAARQIGLLASGLARVRLDVVPPPDAETVAASHTGTNYSTRPHPASSTQAVLSKSLPAADHLDSVPIALPPTDLPPSDSSPRAARPNALPPSAADHPAGDHSTAPDPIYRAESSPIPSNGTSGATSGTISNTTSGTTSGTATFAVQVGVLNNRDQAEELAAAFAKLLGDARVIVSAPGPGGSAMWQIIIGRELSQLQATALVRRILREPISRQLGTPAQVVAEPFSSDPHPLP